MGQSQSTWPQPKAEKDRPPPKAEKLRPPATGGSGKRQEHLRKAASTEDPKKKKKAFDAYPSRDNNLVLTVSLDAITRIGGKPEKHSIRVSDAFFSRL